MKTSTLFIGALLLLGTAAAPLSAADTKCGVGSGVEKPVKKCGASSAAAKCGASKSEAAAKCGSGEKSKEAAKCGSGAKKAPASTKCGTGKCG